MIPGLEQLLAEVGRVHLRGWEPANPRDESLDGNTRHKSRICRKCSILAEHEELYDLVWSLRPFAVLWDAAEREGRCPVCATGNSHTASSCPDERR